MFTLIIIALITIGVGYFATLNTDQISLNFGYKKLDNIPIYIAILIPLFIGLISSWVSNLGNYLDFKRSKKRFKTELLEANGEINDLTKRVHKLELENTKLRAESGKPLDEDSM